MTVASATPAPPPTDMDGNIIEVGSKVLYPRRNRTHDAPSIGRGIVTWVSPDAIPHPRSALRMEGQVFRPIKIRDQELKRVYDCFWPGNCLVVAKFS